MSQVITIEERRKLFEKNKDKIAHTHVYYDAGSDYDMRIIVFWSPEINNWSWIEIPEPFTPNFEINKELEAKYKRLVEQIYRASKKYEDLLDELRYICPICRKRLIYPKNNEWIKSTLHVWSADIIAWCPRCGITLISKTDYHVTDYSFYTYQRGKKRKWKLHISLERIWRTWRFPPHFDAEKCRVIVYENSEISDKVMEFVKEKLGDGFKYISVEQ